MLNFKYYNLLLFFLMSLIYLLVVASVSIYGVDPLKNLRFYSDTERNEKIIGGDFNANYFAAKRYFTGDSLYFVDKQFNKFKDELILGNNHSRFVYYPFSALLFFPVSLLSFDNAFRILIGINLILLPIIILLLSNFCKDSQKYFFVFFSIFIFSPAVWLLLEFGQTDLIILFLLAVCFIFYTKKKFKLSGLALAIASSFKLTPLFLLPFFYFRNKKIFYFSILYFIIFSLLVGVDKVIDFFRSLIVFSSQHSSSYLSTGIFGFFYNKITSQYIDSKIAHLVYLVIVLLLLLLFFKFISRKFLVNYDDKIENDISWFGIFLGIMILIPTVSWVPHSLHLIFVFTGYWIYRERQPLVSKSVVLLDFLILLIFSAPVLLHFFQSYPMLIIFAFRPVYIIIFLLVFYFKFLKKESFCCK